MRRNSSGQVLIGAATLMLVILLTMAASLPVINTSIDPSSSVYNLARFAVKGAIEDLITKMSAYQCAIALWYADNRHKNIDFKGRAEDIENRIKNSLKQVASKSYNLELRNVIVDVPVAKITIFSTSWDGNPDSPSAGRVEVFMAVQVYVSFEYRTKNSGSNFQRYTAWYEEYLTIKGDGGLIKKAFWQGLPWVEFAFGFVPVVGNLAGNIKGVQFALPMRVTNYKAVFDKKPVYPALGLDELAKNMELVMLKPRDKVERFGGRAPEGYWFETIRWVEYNKIDWSAIAIGAALDLIPWRKIFGAVLNAVRSSKQDVTADSPETLYFGRVPGGSDPLDALRYSAKELKEKGMIVEQIKESQGPTYRTSKPRHYTDWSDWLRKQGLTPDQQKALIEQAGAMTKEQVNKAIKAQITILNAWQMALDESLRVVSLELPNIEGIELYQSTSGGGVVPAYYANNNPLVWVGVPLHNGNALFGVCVWLIGAYYPG